VNITATVSNLDNIPGYYPVGSNAGLP